MKFKNEFIKVQQRYDLHGNRSSTTWNFTFFGIQFFCVSISQSYENAAHASLNATTL